MAFDIVFDLVMRDLGDVVPAQSGEERENAVRETERLKSHSADGLSVLGKRIKIGAVSRHASLSPDRHYVPFK